LEGTSYIILSNERDTGYETPVLPQSCHLSNYLVFPPNMAWTMAFTHEDGWLGPYFACHQDHAALDAANHAALLKARQFAEARSKGWCAPESK
jgi:hypothetical protein